MDIWLLTKVSSLHKGLLWTGCILWILTNVQCHIFHTGYSHCPKNPWCTCSSLPQPLATTDLLPISVVCLFQNVLKLESHYVAFRWFHCAPVTETSCFRSLLLKASVGNFLEKHRNSSPTQTWWFRACILTRAPGDPYAHGVREARI